MKLKFVFERFEENICSLLIKVPNEEIIYNCVMSWIKHDQTFRQQYLLTLLQHVRLSFLGVRFLTDVCDNEVGKKGKLFSKINCGSFFPSRF